jgi:hypothetical protein
MRKTKGEYICWNNRQGFIWVVYRVFLFKGFRGFVKYHLRIHGAALVECLRPAGFAGDRGAGDAGGGGKG